MGEEWIGCLVSTLSTPPKAVNAEMKCSDLESDCAAWASAGECEKNPSWMLQHCPVSCSSCDGGLKPADEGSEPAQCIDDSDECAAWAADGECERNSEYMLGSCRRSCGACGSSAAAR